MMKIEAGEREYELVEGWGTLPEGWTWGQVAGVACDSQDRVHVYSRTEHPYMVFDRGGTLVHHGGEDSHFACLPRAAPRPGTSRPPSARPVSGKRLPGPLSRTYASDAAYRLDVFDHR